MAILSTLCYILQENRCLMLHRDAKPDDPNAGKWIGVGGKFEPGESPEDCLTREVREETGLRLTRYAFRGIVTFVSDRYPTEYMHLFTADGFAGDTHPCDEGTLEWVDLARIPALPLWAGDRLFLRLLFAGAPFFSLKLCYRGDELTGAWLDGAPVAF